jgi:hypothetical protein
MNIQATTKCPKVIRFRHREFQCAAGRRVVGNHVDRLNSPSPAGRIFGLGHREKAYAGRGQIKPSARDRIGFERRQLIIRA